MKILLKYKVLLAFIGMTAIGVIAIFGISLYLLRQKNGWLNNFFDSVALLLYGVPSVIGLLFGLLTFLFFKSKMREQKEYRDAYKLSVLITLLLTVIYLMMFIDF
jgi:ABC-type phosphate transport system permease subunit